MTGRWERLGRNTSVLIAALALIISIFTIIPVNVSAQSIPINFQITVTTSGGVNRFFTISSGDTLVQVANPIYTATSANAMLTTRESFSGSVSGDLTGTLSGGAFNTIWFDVTGPTMRGLTVGHATYTDSGGTIDLIMVLDVEATLSGGLIVGASLKGYAFNKGATGAYSGKKVFAKLEGSLTGANQWSFTGRGWIFNEAQCVVSSFSVSGSRANAPGVVRSLTLSASDTIMQFIATDIILPSNAPAQFTTRQRLTGTSSGAISGSFILDSNALIIAGGTYAGRGFSVARFSFTGSPDTIDGFLILDNTNFGVHNGFIVGTSGTGAFANKILIGTFQGSFITPPDYYDYQGSGSVAICSIPPPIGGEIMAQNIKGASSGVLTTLWIYGAIFVAIIAIAAILIKKIE